jgi:hypothetical protein
LSEAQQEAIEAIQSAIAAGNTTGPGIWENIYTILFILWKNISLYNLFIMRKVIHLGDF